MSKDMQLEEGRQQPRRQEHGTFPLTLLFSQHIVLLIIWEIYIMNPDPIYFPVHSGPLPHPWDATHPHPTPEKEEKRKKEQEKKEEKRKRKEGVCCLYLHWPMGKLPVASPLEKTESFPLTSSSQPLDKAINCGELHSIIFGTILKSSLVNDFLSRLLCF